MRRVTHIPSDDESHGFCKGCWNYWFFCDCVNDYIEDGELVKSDESNDDEDDEDLADEYNHDPPAIVSPSPKKKPKPNSPYTPPSTWPYNPNDGPPDDGGDIFDNWPDIFDDGNPDTISGNPGTFVPSVDNQVPVPQQPVDDQPIQNSLINLNYPIQITDFIDKNNNFTWNNPGQIDHPSVLDPYKYYAFHPNPAVWVHNGPVVDSDGSIDPDFTFWFNFQFIPTLISSPLTTHDGKPLDVTNGQNLQPMKGVVLEVSCHVDPTGNEWYSWNDKNGKNHLTEKPPNWSQYFYPELFLSLVRKFERPGTPRSGRRPLPYPPLIFPDSYTDTPIERRSGGGLNPEANNPSNNPGITGNGLFVDVYRGLNVDPWNISKFVIPLNSGVTNGRTTLRSVNGNFGNVDTYMRKESTQFGRFFLINELKETDDKSWAVVEMAFSIPINIGLVRPWGQNIDLEIIQFPVTDLSQKVTIRAPGVGTTITSQTLNIIIPPGLFKYFDTTSSSCVQPGFDMDLGINSPAFDFTYLRHFKKSTSAHLEFGPQPNIPGQLIVPIPNELPSTTLKFQDTFATNQFFSTYPQFNRLEITGTKFNFTTRVSGIWKYPVDFDVDLVNSNVPKLSFKGTAPSTIGYHYGIIPIGQRNGIATGATDGKYSTKAGDIIYDYRLHVNYYSGLWVTTD